MSADDTAPSGEGAREVRVIWRCSSCGWVADEQTIDRTLWRDGPLEVSMVCPECHTEGSFVDHVPAPVMDDDLREQMARALFANDCPGILWRKTGDDERAVWLDQADALLPIVTAEVERAVGAVRAVLAEYRPQLDCRHGPDLPVDLWDDLSAALPAQPADQAQEAGR